MEFGQSLAFQVSVPVLQSASGELVNQAGVAVPAEVFDPDLDNNTDVDIDQPTGLDFGDAPDPTYPTLLASDGARHGMLWPLHFGALVDSDSDGQPTALADGDDIDGTNDDDGVFFTSDVSAGEVSAIISSTQPGFLNAWMDFNSDGDWGDAGEQIFTDTALIPGANALSFVVPVEAAVGMAFSRFRLSSEGGDGPTGLALDGEVEDYAVEIMPASFTLTVSKLGTGSGTVSSISVEGIDCGGDCSEDYDLNTVVTLGAAADAGSGFVVWGGDPDCSDGSVTMIDDVDCTATFDLTYTLTVTTDGTGLGIVTSSPAGIACGVDCEEVYFINTAVQLTAIPVAGSTFSGWSGTPDCTGGMVTMNSHHLCVATFDLICPATLVFEDETLDGGEYRASQEITVGPNVVVDGVDLPVRLISGERVVLQDDVAIFGSFAAETTPDPCP